MYRSNLYNKEELFNIVDQLKIVQEGSEIKTYYGERLIRTSKVSKRYEVFEFSDYIKKFINDIEDQFDIKSYTIKFQGGIQEIELFSDEVVINNKTFKKTLFILSSTDRTRKLSINFGLKSSGFSVISATETSLSKRHLTGLTKHVEEAAKLDVDILNELVDIVKNLINKTVKISEVEKLILGEDEPKAIDIKKFDNFKRNIYYNIDRNSLTQEQKDSLNRSSKYFRYYLNNNMDIQLGAFMVVEQYLRNFNNKDSHLIRVESKKILDITQQMIRMKNIEKALNFNE
jgi:hypothetical protein